MANTKTAKLIKPNMGLSDEARQGIVGLLSRTLANQHMLYMKLRKYHWNVTGPQFRSLHKIFEDMYDEIAVSIDETAEKIRAYGEYAPGTFAEFMEMADVSEEPGENPHARQMVADLVADQETMIRALYEQIDEADDTWEDDASEDFLTGLLHAHQKQAWMLRSFLEGEQV